MFELDENIFYLINHLELGVFETYAVQLRNKYIWIPLYGAVLIYIFIKNNWKIGVALLLGSLICFGVGDQVSSQWIKKSVERPRPCHTDSGVQNVDLKITCGSGFSFTSSHATNHMSLAVFWILAVFQDKKWRYWLFIWALIVGIAQIYVGVHYPSDVLAGFILGGIIGFGANCFYQRFVKSNLLVSTPL